MSGKQKVALIAGIGVVVAGLAAVLVRQVPKILEASEECYYDEE